MRTGLWAWFPLVTALLFSTAGPGKICHAAAPIVPGYERLKIDAKATSSQLGELLLGELNCLSCHDAANAVRVSTKDAPDLRNAGARLTPQFLRAYLADPHGIKPGTTMPDVFHSSDLQARQGAVDYLIHFLVSLGGPIKPSNEAGSRPLIDAGRHLFHTVGCVACHAPEKTSETKIPSVPLAHLAGKTTVEMLAAFLLDPLKVRPGGRMPDVGLSKDQATAVAVYLLRDQMNNPQGKDAGPARVRGVEYRYYETNSHTADLKKLDALQPKSQGRVPRINVKIDGLRENDFAVKLNAILAVPAAGKYTLYIKSDDGSRLYVDGKEVIDNDGEHSVVEKSAAIEFNQGDHPIVATFFQASGGRELSVSWKPENGKKQQLPAHALFNLSGTPMIPLDSEPFVVEPEKARMGKMMFGALGCAGCHTTLGIKPMRPEKTLASLDLNAATGCLSEHPPKGRVQYDFSADQRDAIKAALKNVADLQKPLDAKQQVVHELATMNCYSCHVRDGVGGPDAARAEYFTMAGEFDMGDEGKLPPQLTGVGDKLLPEAIRRIVFARELHIRPIVATHMPKFSAVKMPGLADALASADVQPNEPKSPAFREETVQAGRELVGVKGMGCVNCHGVASVKSLGMPAPELGTVHERLRYSWLRRLLTEPAAVNPNTRMPAFWAGGTVAFKELGGGTMDGQHDAIWNYLSLGRSMPLPAGLQTSEGMELVPTDEPIVHRTMMNGAGNRSVLVGYPEQLSVAFDADVVRLSDVWRGRFFDAKTWWADRGGKHADPPGTDRQKLPAGPAFAMLKSQNDPWPSSGPQDRNAGGQFKGYTLDEHQQPTFRYVLEGVDIQEHPSPLLMAGGAALVRHFDLKAADAPDGFYFLAAQGKKIESKGKAAWIVDDKLTVTLRGIQPNDAPEPFVREVKGATQLLVPVTFKNGKAAFEVEMSW